MTHSASSLTRTYIPLGTQSTALLEVFMLSLASLRTVAPLLALAHSNLPMEKSCSRWTSMCYVALYGQATFPTSTSQQLRILFEWFENGNTHIVCTSVVNAPLIKTISWCSQECHKQTSDRSARLQPILRPSFSRSILPGSNQLARTARQILFHKTRKHKKLRTSDELRLNQKGGI